MKFLLRPVLLILFLAFAVAGCHRKDTTKAAPPPPQVKVTTVEPSELVVYREWVGTLDGNQNAEIQARVAGYLASINYTEGDYVEEGTVLFEIDKHPFEATLAQAQAQLAQAEAKAELAQINLKRQTELFNEQVISEAEFQTTTQDAQADMAAKQAAAANVESAKLNLEFCTITAPFSGIAGRAKGQVGDLVGTGGNMILTTMSEVDPIRLYYPISEQEYMHASEKIGRVSALPLEQRPESIELILSNGETFPHQGRFLFADRGVEQQTGTVLIAAVFPNPGHTLRPGAYGKARMPVRRIQDALLIPQQAVSSLQGQTQVTQVDKDNTVKVVNVTTGAQEGTMIEITDGLSAGDVIVVEGLQRVRDGAKVNPLPYEPPKTAEPGASPTPGTDPTPAPSPESAPSPSPDAETTPETTPTPATES